MAFTYDTTTDRGKVRLLVSDTDTVTAAKQIFTDAEIDALLSISGSVVLLAAAHACRAISADSSKSAIAWSALGESINRQQVPKHFMDLATQFTDQATTADDPMEEIDNFDYNISRYGVDRSEYTGDPLS